MKVEKIINWVMFVASFFAVVILRFIVSANAQKTSIFSYLELFCFVCFILRCVEALCSYFVTGVRSFLAVTFRTLFAFLRIGFAIAN